MFKGRPLSRQDKSELATADGRELIPLYYTKEGDKLICNSTNDNSWLTIKLFENAIEFYSTTLVKYEPQKWWRENNCPQH